MAETRTGRELGGRFIAGDPLRAIAAIWIVSYHVCANALERTTANSAAANLSTDLGEVGHFLSRAIISVFLFFGLSGYLLARPYLHSIIAGTRFPRLSSYARNRALRIVPVFYVAFIATLLIRGRRGEGWSEVLVVPLFSQMYDPSRFSEAIPQTWTLDVELLFYLLLPAAGWLGVKALGGRGTVTSRSLILFGIVVLSGAASIILRTSADEWLEIIWLPGIWFSFAAGIAAAAIEPYLRDRIRTPGAGRATAWALVAVCLATTVYFVWVVDSLLLGGIAGFVAVFTAILAPLVLQWTTGSAWRLLDNRPLHWLGERSYSFYIWHVLVLYLVSRPLPEYEGQPVRTVLVLAIPGIPAVLAATALSFRYIESPFLRRKHLWRRGEEARPGADQAGAPVRGEPTPIPAGPSGG